ncbi:MAG: 30S ribosomal protein S8 [Candidatus Woesearchaeota archaeon]
MTLNDPVANALSVVEHQERIGGTSCKIKPASNLIKQILKILADEHYTGSFTEIKDRKGNVIKLTLTGAINSCGVVKPRFALKSIDYEKFEKRYLPAKGMGILIVSTSKGMMTNTQAKEKKLGGKLIAYCY